MSTSRIYQASPLIVDTEIQLSAAATHHVARVLRAKVGDSFILFNGDGNEYNSTITRIDKKSVYVKILQSIPCDRESPLELYLAQGISRGEKMDFTIQKAVELGVKKIFPLLTERCNVKLDAERSAKRLQHWQDIMIGACEQSGRNSIPEIAKPQALDTFLSETEADHRFVLAPNAQIKLTNQAINKNSRVILLIGPEGGLSPLEISIAQNYHYVPLNLGPRILRTETAAIAALTALQFFAGDLH